VTQTPPLTGVRLVATTVALDLAGLDLAGLDLAGLDLAGLDLSGLDLAGLAGDEGVLWEQPGGLSLAGWGVAARLAVPFDGRPAGEDVAAGLEAIEWEGPRAPMAIGALPFARSEGGEMMVPAVLVRREPDGSTWLTVTSSDPEPPLDSLRRRLLSRRTEGVGAGPGEFQIRSAMDRQLWCRLVADAAAAVAARQLDKVVLAREVTVTADEPLHPAQVASRLRLSHPSCMVFSVAGFVGASPELLVQRTGHHVRSQPLAGTTARPGPGGGDDALGPRMLASTKQRQEHRLVVDAVTAALAPYCDELTAPPVPSLVPFGTLTHLGSLITGNLRSPHPTALDLVGAIHPSPAVGGTPTGAALRYIAQAEQLDRGRYAGPVGWVDADGDGCFAIGIRSAQIEGRRARLMAGVGVVAESDPESELAETDLKLQPMLAAIVRP
jgi:menaquinone-specific isochorismate synthase